MSQREGVGVHHDAGVRCGPALRLTPKALRVGRGAAASDLQKDGVGPCVRHPAKSKACKKTLHVGLGDHLPIGDAALDGPLDQGRDERGGEPFTAVRRIDGDPLQQVPLQEAAPHEAPVLVEPHALVRPLRQREVVCLQERRQFRVPLRPIDRVHADLSHDDHPSE